MGFEVESGFGSPPRVPSAGLGQEGFELKQAFGAAGHPSSGPGVGSGNRFQIFFSTASSRP